MASSHGGSLKVHQFRLNIRSLGEALLIVSCAPFSWNLCDCAHLSQHHCGLLSLLTTIVIFVGNISMILSHHLLCGSIERCSVSTTLQPQANASSLRIALLRDVSAQYGTLSPAPPSDALVEVVASCPTRSAVPKARENLKKLAYVADMHVCLSDHKMACRLSGVHKACCL